MDPLLPESQFKKLDWTNLEQGQSRPSFAPCAHDLIVLKDDGELRIAENASAEQMTDTLRLLNSKFTEFNDGDDSDKTGALTLIRFEDSSPSNEQERPLENDWSIVWAEFDRCRSDNNQDCFLPKLRHTDSPCYLYPSMQVRFNVHNNVQCAKISYDLNVQQGKYVALAHHFHIVATGDGSKLKEMVRIVTYGLDKTKVEDLLFNALEFWKLGSYGLDHESPGNSGPRTPFPHPKAIIYGLLECMEEECRTKLRAEEDWLGKLEDQISRQRDSDCKERRGLEIANIRLDETNVRLGQVRAKIQYLLSSITTIENFRCDPRSRPHFSAISNGVNCGGNAGKLNNYCQRQWSLQLLEVMDRLLLLRAKCEQNSINTETLQHRLNAYLKVVSDLLFQKRQETSEYHAKITEYQAKMLEQQEIIASQTKRDNTIVKIIAVLTALFLPATVTATIFSVPVFHWDQENPIGPHFMTYWLFTLPITATLVLALSIWFFKMWYEDNKLRLVQAKKMARGHAE